MNRCLSPTGANLSRDDALIGDELTWQPWSLSHRLMHAQQMRQYYIRVEFEVGNISSMTTIAHIADLSEGC